VCKRGEDSGSDKTFRASILTGFQNLLGIKIINIKKLRFIKRLNQKIKESQKIFKIAPTGRISSFRTRGRMAGTWIKGSQK